MKNTNMARPMTMILIAVLALLILTMAVAPSLFAKGYMDGLLLGIVGLMIVMVFAGLRRR